MDIHAIRRPPLRAGALLLAAVFTIAACGPPDGGVDREGDAGGDVEAGAPGAGGGSGTAEGGAPPGGGAGGDAVPPSSGDPGVDAFLARVPPEVFVRDGACPFECCVYRAWTAEEAIPVRRAPDGGSPVVATLPDGEPFDALGGRVVVAPTQVVILGDTLRVYGEANRGETLLAAGDTLVPLDNVGEGFIRTWVDGEVWQTPWVWGGTAGTGRDRARVVGERSEAWWARVRTPSGEEGWIRADSARFGNADACGA